MMTYEEFMNDKDYSIRTLPEERWRDAYESYCLHTARNLESAISGHEADKRAAHAVCGEVRNVLLDAMGDAGLPTYEEDGPVPQVLDVARAAAVAIRLMAGGAQA